MSYYYKSYIKNDGSERQKNTLFELTVTIRLRFGANVTRARIDQISLLTARGSFSGSQLLAGTTYLNMPMTQFGGTTTPANVTITSLNVYDEYTDLAGTVAYNGQTYNFSLFGDLFNSNLGHPEDKVGNLRDATGNFDVLYFAVRHTPLMPVANTSLTGDNLALYLQRKGTREITFVDVPLTGTLGNALWMSFGARGRYGEILQADYWFTKILTPQFGEEVPEIIANDAYNKSYIVYDEFKADICTIRVYAKFSLMYDFPDSIPTGENSGEFIASIKYTKGWISAINTNNTSVIKYCEKIYSHISGLTLGSQDYPIQIGTYSLSNGITQQDYLVRGGYQAKVAPSDLKSPMQVYLNIGAPIGPFLSLNLARSLIAENQGSDRDIQAEKPPIFDEFDQTDENGDCHEDQRTKTASYRFLNYELHQKDDTLTAKIVVRQWHGYDYDNNLAVDWSIPVIDVVAYPNEPQYYVNYGRTEYLPYKSGSTGFKPVSRYCR